MDTHIFNSNNHIRYKIGNNYHVYHIADNKPEYIQIHALLSQFENYLRTPIEKKARN